jgi:hypothetical protein
MKFEMTTKSNWLYARTYMVLVEKLAKLQTCSLIKIIVVMLNYS